MEELLNILRQEVELHEQLISMLEIEFEGFGRLRGSELLKLQGEKSRCVRATVRLENERIQLVDKLADSWEMTTKELTLSVIISHATEEFSAPLQQCFDQLKSLILQMGMFQDTINQIQSFLKNELLIYHYKLQILV